MKVRLRLHCAGARGLSPVSHQTYERAGAVAAVGLGHLAPRRSARQYATTAVSSRAAAALRLPADYVSPTKPPSKKAPDLRKSQLLRTYTAMLRSSPVLLIFQHNNLTGAEFAAVRRELSIALEQVAQPNPDGASELRELAANTKLQVVRTGSFDLALRVVEFFDPVAVQPPATGGSSPPKTYTHDLSSAAYDAIQAATAGSTPIPASSVYAQLEPLMVGPLAVLTFPAVSPAHLAAAIRVLAPNAPAFPPPSRKKSPGYYDPIAQSALQKLLLIGGRIEGRVLDLEGVQWVGGIEGGIDSLRAQLVALLQSAGLGLTTALEGASKSLWLTMESRRTVLEETEKGGDTGGKEQSTVAETSAS